MDAASLEEGDESMNKKDKIALAKAFMDLLDANEEMMGEGAAYLVTCEQMGIDPDDGYSLMAEVAS